VTADKQAKCPYCGRRVASNHKPYVKRGYFANGEDFKGHRSCFLEMTNPEDERFGHLRHDIRTG
jgi:hypothetical protein